MQIRTRFALLLCLPSFAMAEDCFVETETHTMYVSDWEAADTRQQELLEAAQRAWLEYRDANCELMSERDREDLRADALATCLDFMDRERELELRLIGRFVGH